MKDSVRILKMLLPGILFAVFFGCRPETQVMAKDPFYESFFEKTRLIMTDEEIQVYKSLPDRESKEDFIADFWALRDSNPSTEENEAKEEFDRRIEYANKWFGSFNPDRGRDTQRDYHSKVGWSSDRGRIYLVFGEPEAMSFGRSDENIPDIRVDGYRTPMDETRYAYESWWYELYQLAVTFYREDDDWRLYPDSLLLQSMEIAKLNWLSKDASADPKKAFRFSADYKDGKLLIRIPSKRVSFDDKLNARFKIRVNVYLNNKKLKTIEETRTLELEEGKLLKTKNLSLEIPVLPDKKGSYYFDIILEDNLAPTFSKFRTSVRAKI